MRHETFSTTRPIPLPLLLKTELRLSKGLPHHMFFRLSVQSVRAQAIRQAAGDSDHLSRAVKKTGHGQRPCLARIFTGLGALATKVTRWIPCRKFWMADRSTTETAWFSLDDLQLASQLS